ncbi:TetR family transcriptional regulator [Actinopolyspora erythraea]|uniref:TetR family transcriptional regulator n=1 Tax=Actinopolyspora erythraea TaxID=414996 RepID=A0A099D7W8_9ACTN|nr:TetR family transcriptional regulator [Actinopolyspora erythraea]ASU78719.1 TetR family transcriptional regulator [Actinopolyspora erythraea]KGI81475.1 TetR family transcriptional regulator [Actinopolyspora erythraea]
MTSVAVDPTDETEGQGRRAVKAARTRAGIEAAALRLFREQGFEATTVEQIAREAEIAPRTFFRYFPSKDAVLFGDLGNELEYVREALNARGSGEHPMRALATSMLDAAERMESDREQHLMRAELLQVLESTGQYEMYLMRQRWMQDMTELVAEHIGTDASCDPRPGAWSMTMISCFGSAMHAWLTRRDGTPLREILVEVLDSACDGLSQAALKAHES